MPAKQDEAMTKTIEKETGPEVTLIPPEASESGLERAGARCASSSPPPGEDLIPYSAKDLKYMWTMWDEAHRRHPSGLRYRNIYAGAFGVILAGWLSYRIGLSFSAPLGSILMLGGALIGAWYSLKALRHKRRSAPER
jgi:hypothetical protein